MKRKSATPSQPSKIWLWVLLVVIGVLAGGAGIYIFFMAQLMSLWEHS